jgi:hypothetical protein
MAPKNEDRKVRVSQLARDFDTSPSTIIRQGLRGATLSDGTRIYPEGFERRPGGWYLAPAALREFYRRLTEDRLGQAPERRQAPRAVALPAEHEAAVRACELAGL